MASFPGQVVPATADDVGGAQPEVGDEPAHRRRDLHAALRSVPPESAGSASGVLTTAQQIGNALGVAIAGAVFFGALGDASSAHA